MLILLNGAARLQFVPYEAVTLGPVYGFHPSIRRPFITVDYGGTSRMAWTGEFPNESPNPADWMDLADLDLDVAEALAIYGSLTHSVQERIRNLFDVLEIVGADVGGKTRLTKKEWVESGALNRCWGTLNSARHARLRDSPPSNPMRLYESEKLIRRLMQLWFEEKVSEHRDSQVST